jgi:hypothetical protein
MTLSQDRRDRYLLRVATNDHAPAVWRLISAVLLSYGNTPDRATTDRDLVDLEATYGPAGFFVLLELSNSRD